MHCAVKRRRTLLDEGSSSIERIAPFPVALYTQLLEVTGAGNSLGSTLLRLQQAGEIRICKMALPGAEQRAVVIRSHLLLYLAELRSRFGSAVNAASSAVSISGVSTREVAASASAVHASNEHGTSAASVVTPASAPRFTLPFSASPDGPAVPFLLALDAFEELLLESASRMQFSTADLLTCVQSALTKQQSSISGKGGSSGSSSSSSSSSSHCGSSSCGSAAATGGGGSVAEMEASVEARATDAKAPLPAPHLGLALVPSDSGAITAPVRTRTRSTTPHSGAGASAALAAAGALMPGVISFLLREGLIVRHLTVAAGGSSLLAGPGSADRHHDYDRHHGDVAGSSSSLSSSARRALTADGAASRSAAEAVLRAAAAAGIATGAGAGAAAGGAAGAGADSGTGSAGSFAGRPSESGSHQHLLNELFSFGVPASGLLCRFATDGRAELLQRLRARKHGEMPRAEAEALQLVRSPLPARFHIRDAIGAGLVHVFRVPSGHAHLRVAEARARSSGPASGDRGSAASATASDAMPGPAAGAGAGIGGAAAGLPGRGGGRGRGAGAGTGGYAGRGRGRGRM